jgi:hypothetical protein
VRQNGPSMSETDGLTGRHCELPCEAVQDRLVSVEGTPSWTMEVSSTPPASVLVTPGIAGGVSSSYGSGVNGISGDAGLRMRLGFQALDVLIDRSVRYQPPLTYLDAANLAGRDLAEEARATETGARHGFRYREQLSGHRLTFRGLCASHKIRLDYREGHVTPTETSNIVKTPQEVEIFS